MANYKSKKSEQQKEVDVTTVQAREWLNAKEVAVLINVNVFTVYRWVNEGAIPFSKVGSVLRFNRNDINDWLRSRRQERNAERQKTVATLAKMGIKIRK